VEALQNYALTNHSESVIVSAKLEAELFEMKEEEKMELLSSLGMTEPALASSFLALQYPPSLTYLPSHLLCSCSGCKEDV